MSTIEEKPEEESEYEEEEDWEYEEETESEDEAVDREVERRRSLEQEEKKAKTAAAAATPGDSNGHGGVEEAELKADDRHNGKQENGSKAAAGEEESKRRRSSDKNGDEDGGKSRRHHHKKHKKSRHLERLEAFSKKDENGGESNSRRKRIHVRSKDPSRIARQIEKSLSAAPKTGGGRGGGKGRPSVAPPQQKVTQECKICGKEPYVVERIVAEKAWWHKNCFRCKECNKILNLDTYMSHEGVIYCKPHHRELFQPKVVKEDLVDVSGNGNKSKKSRSAARVDASFTQEAIARHREQERRMETIVRESLPEDLGEEVVKASAVTSDESKYQGLENLDVGSKFKMFESGGGDQRTSTDRYGIMEKLRRLEEGEDLEELLAEIDEDIPDDIVAEVDADPEEEAMTVVQKRAHKAENLFGEGGQDRRDRLAAERRKELKQLREKLMAGTRDAVVDQFGDLLNASANKVRKTKVDVRSANAAKFREMFDKGEVPEGGTTGDRTMQDKEHELEMMRKTKRQQKEFFRKMEMGQLDEDGAAPKEPKLLVGKITKTGDGELGAGDVPELASLSNRFSFFEHFEEKEEDKKKSRKSGRLSPTGETDVARKECKASNVLNKFKEMETRALNGEDEVRPPDDPDKPVISALGFLGKLPGETLST